MTASLVNDVKVPPPYAWSFIVGSPYIECEMSWANQYPMRDRGGFKLGPHSRGCKCRNCMTGVVLQSPAQIVRDEILMTVWEDVLTRISDFERIDVIVASHV